MAERKDLVDSRKLIRIVEKLNDIGAKTKFTYTYEHHSLKLRTESLKVIERRKGLDDFLDAYERGDAQPLYFDVYKDSETPFTIVVTEYEDFVNYSRQIIDYSGSFLLQWLPPDTPPQALRAVPALIMLLLVYFCILEGEFFLDFIKEVRRRREVRRVSGHTMGQNHHIP